MGVMTWGQLRMNLQQTLPGISLDLIDEFLNVRYARVLDHTRWLGLEGTAYVETVAAYQSTTDTVAVTQGSNTIVGTATAWNSGMTGQKILIGGDGALYTFTYVNATHATLDRVYEANSNSGLAYSLVTNVYALPADFKALVDKDDAVQGAEDGFPLDQLSEPDLDSSVGFRTAIGEPAVVSVAISPASLDGGTTWQIEFYPMPQYAKGYKIRYLRAAVAFNGTNTSASSLPFVSDGVLLAGCRSDIWAYDGNQAKMTFYEAKFADELAAMVRADRLKRARETLKPAKRFTRHRIERLLRNSSPRIPN